MRAFAVLGECGVPVERRFTLNLLQAGEVVVAEGAFIDGGLEVLDEVGAAHADLVRAAVDIVLNALDLALQILVAGVALGERLLVVEGALPVVARVGGAVVGGLDRHVAIGATQSALPVNTLLEEFVTWMLCF